MPGESESESAMDVKNSSDAEGGAKMAAVVLVDASDMKEYVVHLNEGNAKRAATDVIYALALLNAEKARLSKSNTGAGSSMETGNTETSVTSPTNHDDGLFRWSYVETEYLIREYRRLQPLFNSGRVSHKKCWNTIADALNKEGVSVTASQCISKYRTLKRTYKAIKQHAAETGQMRMWRFYKDVEALLANDASERTSLGSSEMKTEPFLNSTENDWRMDTDASYDTVDLLEQELGLADDGDEPYRWSHEAIMLLIEQAIQVRPLCESGILTQRKCWDRVATELCRKGFAVSGRQCLTKFNCLRRTYKSITEYNARLERGEVAGRGRRLDWKYYDVVGRLLEESWTCTINNGKSSGEQKTVSQDEVMIQDSDGNSYGIIEILDEEEFKPSASSSDNSFIKQNGTDVLSADREVSDTSVSKTAPKEEPSTQVPDLTWCDNSTRLLIGELREQKNTADAKRAKDGKTSWTEISDSLKKKGFPFSADQVEARWHDLEKAFRFFGRGKSTSTVRIAPYYAELRKILGRSPMLFGSQLQSGSLQRTGKYFGPRRGVLIAKPPIRKVPSGTQACTGDKSSATQAPTREATETPHSINSDQPLHVPTLNSKHAVASEESLGEQDKGRQRSRLKRQEALCALRELKEEIAKQTSEIERHAKQREAYCQKIIEQNEIMIKQRDRRNDLLEELMLLRRQEFH